MQSSRENILQKIKKRLADLPTFYEANKEQPQVFIQSDENLDVTFAKNFTHVGGNFIFCKNLVDFSHQLQTLVQNNQWKDIWVTDKKIVEMFSELDLNFPSSNALEKSQAAITTCESLIAQTGSIVVSSGQTDGRIANVYSPNHICVAYSHQVVEKTDDFLKLIKKKKDKNAFASLYSFITGPSRTADIEKTLVKGIHGPSQVYLFFIDQMSFT